MKYIILVVGMLLSTMAQAEKIIETTARECSQLRVDVGPDHHRPRPAWEIFAGVGTRGELGYRYKDSILVFNCNPFGLTFIDVNQRGPQTHADLAYIYIYSKQEWKIDKQRLAQQREDLARRVDAERNARLSVLTR